MENKTYILRLYKTVIAIVAFCTLSNVVFAQNDIERIILDGSYTRDAELPMLAQSDFIHNNAVYVITKDFNLVGDITIPENCVLNFDGGCIKNGIINCNNTFLNGKVQLVNIILNGSIANNRIESDWFGLVEGNKNGIDNCEVISSLIASCENTKKDLHISNGIYRTSQPVKFNVDYNVYMDGAFLYTGSQSVSAIFIGSDEGRKGGKEFHLAVCQLKYPKYKEDNNHCISSAPRNVGIEVSSVYSCQFYINKIEEFINGLVIIDNRGLGCGDNEFHIGQIINAYNGITIVAGNKTDQICWVNDNAFIGGRIWSYKDTQLRRTAIKFKRFTSKGMSDNTLFLAMDLENNYNAIDFGGFATGCISLGCRFENNENPVINEGNNGNLIIGGQKYLNNITLGPRTFYDYASELWKLKINKVILDLPQIDFAYDGVNVSTLNIRISDREKYYEVGEHVLPSGIRKDGELNINHTRFFIDIDIAKLKMLRIETIGQWRVMMDFFDKHGNKIKPFKNYREHLYFYNHNIDGWYNDDGVFVVAYKMETNMPLDIFIKDNDIYRIRLYIWGDSSFGECWIKSLRITADEYAEVDNVNKSFHLSSRPIKTKGVDVIPNGINYDIKPGTVYVDSNNKPIFWNGNEWVDASGNIIK